MRFYEICEGRRSAEQSLRHLNRQKREEQRHLRNEDERFALARVMYANIKRQLDWLEFEKAELELEQQRMEVVAAKAEAESAGAEQLSDAALDGMEQREQRRRAIERMAAKERKRRQSRRLKR